MRLTPEQQLEVIRDLQAFARQPTATLAIRDYVAKELQERLAEYNASMQRQREHDQIQQAALDKVTEQQRAREQADAERMAREYEAQRRPLAQQHVDWLRAEAQKMQQEYMGAQQAAPTWLNFVRGLAPQTREEYAAAFNSLYVAKRRATEDGEYQRLLDMEQSLTAQLQAHKAAAVETGTEWPLPEWGVSHEEREEEEGFTE